MSEDVDRLDRVEEVLDELHVENYTPELVDEIAHREQRRIARKNTLLIILSIIFWAYQAFLAWYFAISYDRAVEAASVVHPSNPELLTMVFGTAAVFSGLLILELGKKVSRRRSPPLEVAVIRAIQTLERRDSPLVDDIEEADS